MRPRNVTLTVDGRRVESRADRLLIHVLRDLGIRVPTLCHDDRLTPHGGCRLCVVDRQDEDCLVPACSTPVEEGMVIRTETPEVVESRRRQLQLLLLDHRLECPVCWRSGDCRLQDLVYELGVIDEPLPFDAVPRPADDVSPVIHRDPEKCVLCGRCVRLCEEVQGVAAIGFADRGLGLHVTTFDNRALDCEFCGQCVNACPVASLTTRFDEPRVPFWLRTRVSTTCSFCSCGCDLVVESNDGRLHRVTGSPEAPPNRGKLCVKGWLGLDLLGSDDRLTVPLIRRNGRLVEVGWDEALDAAAKGLQRAADRRTATVALASGRLSCEDGYLLQRFVRGVLGSPHVSMAAVGGVEALVEGLAPVASWPRSTARLEDVREADLVVVLRADPTRTHPLVKTELIQGVHGRGQKLVLCHALSGDLERHADLHLPVAPGSEDCLLRGAAGELIRVRPSLAADAHERPGGVEWTESLRGYTGELVRRQTGVPPHLVARLVRLLLEARRPQLVVVCGTGIPGDESSVARAAAELTTVLPGSAGVLVLPEKANVLGLLEVGLHPALLPGARPAGVPSMIDEVASLVDSPIPTAAGWGPRDLMAEAVHGRVGAMLLMGVDPVRSFPRSFHAHQALESARFVICADAFLTDSARMADVVLPAAILAERGGTMIGIDGARRWLRKAVPPPAGLPGDGELLRELARRLGADLPWAEDLEAEMDRVVGWTLAPGSVVRLEPAPSPAGGEAWSGFLLDGSPQLFHSGSVTTRSAILRELAPPVAVRLNPADARRLGVSGGDVVSVSSGLGELMLRARVDRTVRAGSALVLWGAGRHGARELAQEAHQPVAVRLRRPC